MHYNILKILHILSATAFVTSVVICLQQWRNGVAALSIQATTWRLILPFALFQLVTGFTLISLKHFATMPAWIIGSMMSFMTAISAWFIFLIVIQKYPNQRVASFIPLSVFFIALLTMIFLMANQP